MLDMNQVIANNIINLLKKHNKRQQDLAEGIGTSKQIVSKMLNGSRAINAVELSKIANFLGEPMEMLVKIPRVPKETSFTLAFMGRVTSEGGRKALETADTLSDMILFHTKVRENGMKMLQPQEDI